MSVARRILSNTFIQTLGKVATAVLSVVIIKYITSLETVPGYQGVSAEYKLIYSYLAFFGIIADFGLFTIAVREFARGEKETKYILGNIFSMRFISIIGAMLFAVLVVFLIKDGNYTANVKIGVVIAAVTTAFTMLASTITSVLQEKLKMSFPTLVLVLGKIIMTGYIVYVVTHYSIISGPFNQLLFAGVVGSGVVFLFTYFYTYRVVPFKPRFDTLYWKEVFYKSLPYGFAIILSTLYVKIDIILLSFMRDQQEIAIYGYPASVIEMISVVPIYFMNSVLPSLTRAVKEGGEKITRIIHYSFQFLFLMVVPVVVGGVLVAGPFIHLIMNDVFLSDFSVGYIGSDVAFQLILVSLLFSFLSILFGFVLVALEKQKKLLIINLVVVLFNIISNLIIIPFYGFVGAAITTVFSEFLVLTLTFYEVKKHARVVFDFFTLFKILACGAVMAAVVYLSSSLNIFAVIVIGAVTYFFTAYLLGVVKLSVFKELKIL